MSPRKLTDQDKEELLVAYRETAETTSTLAARYGVSSSTVSRFLKSRLSPTEYEELIQQKRLGRGGTGSREEQPAPEPPEPAAKTLEKPKLVIKRKPESVTPAITQTPDQDAEKTTGRRRTRRKSSVPEPSPILEISEPPTMTDEMILEGFADDFDETQYDLPPSVDELDLEEFADDEAEFEDDLDFEEEEIGDNFEPMEINPDLLALAQEIQLGDRQQALKDLLGDDIGDEDEFDDDEDEDDEDEDFEDDEALDLTPVAPSETVEILPLEAAQFPRICYVVTDRVSELIARPMQEFRDLGDIPDGEITQKTLPVFDNHRVAKRFIRGRTQKIVKIPNGELFFKTSGCLAAKGITRLLLDGKVYELS